MKDKLLFRLDCAGYPVPDYLVPIWYDEGRVVMDGDNHPVKQYRNLPLTLSSNADMYMLENIYREDTRITYADFRARMPLIVYNAEGTKGTSLGSLSMISMRFARFRLINSLPPWNARQGKSILREFVWNKLSENGRKNNSTEELDSLTNLEREEIKSIEKGKYPARAGAQFLSPRTRQRRQAAEERKIAKLEVKEGRKMQIPNIDRSVKRKQAPGFPIRKENNGPKFKKLRRRLRLGHIKRYQDYIYITSSTACDGGNDSPEAEVSLSKRSSMANQSIPQGTNSPQIFRDTQIYFADDLNLGKNISQPISGISEYRHQQNQGYAAPSQSEVIKGPCEQPYNLSFGPLPSESHNGTPYCSQYDSPYEPNGLSARGLQYFSVNRPDFRAQISSPANQWVPLQKPSELASDQGSHLPTGGNVPNNSNLEVSVISHNEIIRMGNDVSQNDWVDQCLAWYPDAFRNCFSDSLAGSTLRQ